MRPRLLLFLGLLGALPAWADAPGDRLATDLAALKAAAPGEARVTAAGPLLAYGPDMVEPLIARLTAPRTSTDEERRAILARIGADVPTPDGKFKTPPRLKKGEVVKEVEWLKELAPIADGGVALDETLETVVVIRALAATKDFRAADALYEFAFSPEGTTFRDEVGRQLRAMSPYSLPTLVRASQDKKLAAGSYGRYAAYQLDKMDKARPSYALAAAPDDTVEIAILGALGDGKHPDAVPTVLDKCDAPQPGIRRAAREAFLAYVTGPPPPPAPKAKRKLPGGKMSEEELPLYLTYRELAVQELKVRLEQFGATVEKKATGEDLTRQLFALYDQRRVAQWDETMKAATALAGEQKWTEAVAGYDEILRAEPLYERRGEMVPAYLEHGRTLAAAEKWPEAVIAFEKAYSLAPDGPHAGAAGGELHYARAQILIAAGRPAEDELAQALASDPDHPAAKKAFVQERKGSVRARRGWMLYAGLGGGGAALLLFGIGLALRKRG